jgi:hypothetical protein
MLVGTAAWNPASVAANSRASTNVTVTGAVVGQPVIAGFSSITAAGWFISGSVISANTVSVSILNVTGASVDLPNGTVTAIVVVP